MGILAKRKRKRGMGEIPMSSTSDVAFLLLIFFIVMPMKQDEVGISLLLPAKKTEQTTVRVRQSNVATIRVHRDHHLTLDGVTIALSAIRDAIRERWEANEQTVVILETHPDADYGWMIACLDEVKLSGARKFTLKTTKI